MSPTLSRYPALHPREFARFHRRFNFTVDAAADDLNHQLDDYWTVADDALSIDWTGERVWCHPPFENVKPWINKARKKEAELTAMLLREDLVPVWDRTATIEWHLMPMMLWEPMSGREGRAKYLTALVIWS